MSLNKRTYSPMSSTYSYSSTLSPSYSYSRVNTYLDALEKDETITRLKRELTGVKSLQMKYHTLLQEISIADKQNQLLESRNDQLESEYMQKIKVVRNQTSSMQVQLKSITQRLDQQQQNVDNVQSEIQTLLQHLKQLKLEEQTIQAQNKQLETQVEQCNLHLAKLTVQQKQLSQSKSIVHQNSKQTTQGMEKAMVDLARLTQTMQKYQQELSMLEKECQRFSLQEENMQTIYKKNVTLLQNFERKVKIQEGQNQQLSTQLAQMTQAWQKMESKRLNDKQSFYQSIVRVQENSLILKQTLCDLDNALQKDSTQKQYLKDISTKHGRISGQNDQLRQLLKHLQETYTEKKAFETRIMEDISRKIKTDQTLKAGIEQRTKQLQQLREKFMN